MKVFGVNIKVKLIVIVLLVFLIITVVLSYFYITNDINEKWGALVSGLVTGLIILIVQLILSWDLYMITEKIKRLKIKDLIAHRNNQDSFVKLIKSSNSEMRFMATTASRFLSSFADLESKRDDNTILIKALERGVKVKMLLPDHKFLEESDKLRTVDYIHEKLSTKYKNYSYRYFNHIPTHYILIFDDECIVGPMFRGLACRETPALRVGVSSQYVKEYINYFDREWSMAKNNKFTHHKKLNDLILIQKN